MIRVKRTLDYFKLITWVYFKKRCFFNYTSTCTCTYIYKEIFLKIADHADSIMFKGTMTIWPRQKKLTAQQEKRRLSCNEHETLSKLYSHIAFVCFIQHPLFYLQDLAAVVGKASAVNIRAFFTAKDDT